jgi:predicted HicB family RNase H-like nuclease
MSNLGYRGYSARFEYDPHDRIFVGRLVGIDTIAVFHGATVDELEAAFRASVDHYLEICERLGHTPQAPDRAGIAVSVPPDVYAAVRTAAERRGTSVERWAAEVLATAARG